MNRLTYCVLPSILAVVCLLASQGKAAEPTRPSGSQELRVATAQIAVTTDIDKNVETIGRAIDRALAEKADVLLTPEGSLSGYTPKFDQQKVEQALRQLVDKASSAGLALALGTCFVEPDDQLCYDQIRFYDADGTYLGFHSKTLRCGSMTDHPPKGEINDYAARPLRTYQLNGITVGGLICNDMWANPGCTPMPDPHLSQQLSEMGAQIIFEAVNGGRSGNAWSREVYWPFHETNMRIRAQTGKVWIVVADNCYPTNIPCSCPSGVLGPDGNWAVKAPDRGEQMVFHTIELK
jgi:predicted amidohydrolase